MNLRALKYISPLSIYVLAWLGFTRHGWFSWAALGYTWVLIPLAELFLRPDPKNMDQAAEDLAKKDPVYDILLYAVVFLQFGALLYFLWAMKDPGLHYWERAGMIWSMGMLCGTFGINVGHELGHRVNRMEQFLAQCLLMTSLYMHFFIEHNKGHHKHVATPQDPSSARKNEPVYSFYFRTMWYSYVSAWKISNRELAKKGLPFWHPKNLMIRFHLVQLLFLAAIGWGAGLFPLFCFVNAAFIGAALLETVNYIEHYGLQRRLGANGQYERPLPIHSWNSDHPLGRLMLFELSRHSDHHYMASRKYQVLKHHDEAPQLPTGYPGSMMLAMIPPLWFRIMNPRLKTIRNSTESAL